MNTDVFFHSFSPSFPDANCRDIDDPDLFFPETKAQLDEVLPAIRTICGSCVHQADCLRFALDEGIEHGIWGGFAPGERKAMGARRARRRYVVGNSERIYAMRESGMKFTEIARELNSTPDAVSQSYHRHVKKMQAQA